MADVVWILLGHCSASRTCVGGAVVGLLIMWLLPLPRVPVEGRVHLFSMVKLVGTIIFYAAQSRRSGVAGRAAVRRRSPGSCAEAGHQVDLVLTLCV